MSKKRFKFQIYFWVNSEYNYLAFNQDGSLNGFMHPPIRDFELGVWQDSVDGSYGHVVPYDGWDTSVKKTSEMSDQSNINVPQRTREKREREKAKNGNSNNEKRVCDDPADPGSGNC